LVNSYIILCYSMFNLFKFKDSYDDF
jgi:hypothetical protein